MSGPAGAGGMAEGEGVQNVGGPVLKVSEGPPNPVLAVACAPEAATRAGMATAVAGVPKSASENMDVEATGGGGGGCSGVASKMPNRLMEGPPTCPRSA